MNKLRIYTDFDLPTNHLPQENHFVPPKARDPEEITRRRTLAPGTLLTEYEKAGICIAITILKNVFEPEDMQFTADLIASGGLNTAWYNFAQNASVMRRRLKLPITTQASTPDELIKVIPSEVRFNNAIKLFEEGGSRVQVVNHASEKRLKKLTKEKKKLGQTLGNASLTLACYNVSEANYFDEAGSSQYSNFAVRNRCLELLERSRVLEKQIGSHPSLAHLADPDSDLAIFWRRSAPNGAYEAYEYAIEEPALSLV